jgi:cytochrome c oxidase accessory protein FixG
LASDAFRDHVSTIGKKGKHIRLYPRKPRGKFHRLRVMVAVFLLSFFFIAPFIKIYDRPLLLFNILERKFILLGITFWPQDFHLFVLATIILIIFIILFTVVFGRLWCGWACPQTIFMEMVFRKIEYWLEGDTFKQQKLARQPYHFKKTFIKIIKHILFYGISFIIGNTFLAYIIGIDDLFTIITDPPSQHISGLSIMILFSAVFYWVFALFREQVCTMVCPYGRLQGVLLDQNSIVVAYDFKRGEPRGKLNRQKVRSIRGDCVDCNQCVAICPTGIDIRNGTQLECINCTACMDACDWVMTKVKKPLGLIRYASYKNLSEGQKLLLTPRSIGYSVVLFILMLIALALFLTRNDIETTILRTPGILAQETDQGTLTNLFNLKVVNKTYSDLPLEIRLLSPMGKIKTVVPLLSVPAADLLESVFFIEIDKEMIKDQVMPLEIGLYSNGRQLETIRTTFVSITN